MPVVIIAQVIGFIAVCENLFIYLSNKRDRILQLKFLSDALWAVNYLLMGGCTGAMLNMIGMVRESVFFMRDRAKWADKTFWPIVFAVLAWISPVTEWIAQGSFSLLPIVPTMGSMIFVIALYQRSTLSTKLFSILGNALWLTYAGIIGNVTGLLCNSIMLLSALIGIFRERKK